MRCPPHRPFSNVLALVAFSASIFAQRRERLDSFTFEGSVDFRGSALSARALQLLQGRLLFATEYNPLPQAESSDPPDRLERSTALAASAAHLRTTNCRYSLS